MLIDNVLYHLVVDNLLRMLPKEDRLAVFKEVHKGKFAGQLRDAKIQSVKQSILVAKMHKDIVGWCRACVVCVHHVTWGDRSNHI